MKHCCHSDNNKPTHGSQSSTQPGVPEVIHDLMRWWDLAKARAAEQAKMVPHLSRHACSTLRRRMLGSHLAFALAQQPHESVHFLRPPPSNFSSQDDEPSSGAGTHKLRAGPLLSSTCRNQNCAI